MTSYAVSGNVREQLGAEGATEISAAQAGAIAVVAENIDSIVLVAESLAVPGFSDLASVTAACVAAQTAAQNAAAAAAQSAADSAASAVSVGSSAAAAEAWARQMGGPVQGTDVSAKQSAIDADASATQADFSAVAAGTSASSAAAAEALAEAYASAPPGTEVEPGQFSIPTYVGQMQTLLGQAPVLAGRVITGGAAGTTTVNLAASDFFRTIEVNNAAGSDTKFKCVQGLFTGPPPSGLARSYAWIHLIRSGAGAVSVEGPSDPGGGTVTTVFRPKRVAAPVTVDKSTTSPGTATAVTGSAPTLAVPNGTSRRVVVVAHAIYWTQAPAAEPAHAITVASANVVGMTQLQTVGVGTNTDASPILTRLFTGTIADGAALADLALTYNFGGFLARGHLEVYVYQDVSAVEHDAAQATAAVVGTLAKAFACTDANSVNVVAFAWKRKQTDATPAIAVAISPATADADDALFQSTSGSATNNDLVFATQQDAGLAATTYTYTATPSSTNPATVAGLVLRPRTVTTVNPGDDGLITDSTKPFTIPAKGGHAMVLAASDGTSWYADQ